MDVESHTSVFRWSPELDYLYRQLIPASGRTVTEVAGVLKVGPDDLRTQLVAMLERGIITIDDDDVLRVSEPGVAVNHMIGLQSAMLQSMSEELGRIHEVLPALLDAGPFQARHESDRVAGEVTDGVDPLKLQIDWVRGSSGDICFLRPDASHPVEGSLLAEEVDRAIGRGRVVRAIYPAEALKEAPEHLEARASAGEQVRVVPAVVSQMTIVGVWRAYVPEPLGHGSDRSVVLRQPSVVQVCQAWFDMLWSRGTPVLDPRAARDRRDRRAALLNQLASGVKDEQIARNLDVSLRTVRRGVADLLLELDVDTRFQAGVEAVRRGWL